MRGSYYLRVKRLTPYFFRHSTLIKTIICRSILYSISLYSPTILHQYNIIIWFFTELFTLVNAWYMDSEPNIDNHFWLPLLNSLGILDMGDSTEGQTATNKKAKFYACSKYFENTTYATLSKIFRFYCMLYSLLFDE